MAYDDNVRDDAEDPSDKHRGIAVGVGVVVAVLVIVFIAGLIYTAASNNPPGSTTCSTTCLGFTRWECPGTRFMGGCFGVWVCAQPMHTCGTNPP